MTRNTSGDQIQYWNETAGLNGVHDQETLDRQIVERAPADRELGPPEASEAAIRAVRDALAPDDEPGRTFRLGSASGLATARR